MSVGAVNNNQQNTYAVVGGGAGLATGAVQAQLTVTFQNRGLKTSI